MEKNVLLTIEYDGSGFSGWQRQPEKRTVQGVIEGVLSDLLGSDIRISGVSRTDAGVHAMDQKAAFSADINIPVENLARVMNGRLQGRPEARAENDDIRIVAAEEIRDAKDIRGLVKGKTYRYSVRNAGYMPVFKRNYRYLVKDPLDLERMNEAAGYIIGTHDFRCFQAAGAEPGRTTVRTVTDLTVSRDGEDVFIDITGDGFLYNMVRIITGTLVEVGLGKREPSDMKRILESGDRKEAGHTAPPQGLALMRVYMDGGM